MPSLAGGPTRYAKIGHRPFAMPGRSRSKPCASMALDGTRIESHGVVHASNGRGVGVATKDWRPASAVQSFIPRTGSQTRDGLLPSMKLPSTLFGIAFFAAWKIYISQRNGIHRAAPRSDAILARPLAARSCATASPVSATGRGSAICRE